MTSIFPALTQEERIKVLKSRKHKAKFKFADTQESQTWEAAKAGNEEAIQIIFKLLPI